MIRIDIPWSYIGRISSQQGKHWTRTSKPIQSMRQLAEFLAHDADNRPVGQRAEITYRFRVPDNRRRDAANLIQQMKAAVDGIVDSKLLPDDRWEVLAIGQVSIVVDKINPGCEIVVEGV